MPRVAITFDDESGEYTVDPVHKDAEYDEEYQVVVDIKSSRYRDILRNANRVQKDQQFLQDFFIQAQMAGRALREQ